MNKSIILLLLSIILILRPILTQNINTELIDDSQKPQPIDPNHQQQMKNPFSHNRQRMDHNRGHQKFNRDHKQKRQQFNGVYRPFPLDQQERKQKRQQKRHSDQEYDEQFNRLLGWGMFFGSIFLAIVLIKTCIRKKQPRTHRMQRDLQRQNPIIYRMPQAQRNNQHIYFPSQSNNIDEQIKLHQTQINRLKQIKNQLLKKQFALKKIQQQKRIQMMNRQTRKDFNNYGPQYYYAQGQYFSTQNNFQQNQPFTVKNIQPIQRRQRSNSFKTELSQIPIIKNEIKYRNGIPIGKPLKQHDNDSSFASEYPEV